MSLDLDLLRHGQATGQGGDAALTEGGLRQIDRLAARLAALRWRPDLVFASPLFRAQQTAQRLLAGVGFDRDIRTLSELLPDTEPDRLAGALEALVLDARAVVVVAHQPLLSRFARWGTGEETSFSTGALVRVRFEGAPGPGLGHRVLQLSPEDLAGA